MWHCLLGGHQPAEVRVRELNVAPRDAPQPVWEGLVLSRMLHCCRFAKWPFHVNRPWCQSSRSRIIAEDSGTRLFQFALWAILWYALHRRSLAGRMALVRATPWPITAASFQTGTWPCCLKRRNRQSMYHMGLAWKHLERGWACCIDKEAQELLGLAWRQVGLCKVDLPAQLVEEVEGAGCMFQRLPVRVANDDEVIHVGHHLHALVAKVMDCCLHKATE